MPSIKLTDEFIAHFKIDGFTSAQPGGQKNVFIVEIGKIKYALKIIKSVDERFEREVKICNEFSDNKGIPSILRIEEFESETVILEEYIEGNDLNDIISEFKGNELQVKSLIHQIGLIMEPIWNSNYIHRDLKPQNIRVRTNGTPVVLDFGIARALDEASITNTGHGQPHTWTFASPEQYNGNKKLISYRTDFFCLGIIAYYLYENKLPFGRTKIEIEKAFANDELVIETKSNLINVFCNTVFKISPSERPRKVENFLNLIKP